MNKNLLLLVSLVCIIDCMHASLPRQAIRTGYRGFATLARASARKAPSMVRTIEMSKTQPLVVATKYVSSQNKQREELFNKINTNEMIIERGKLDAVLQPAQETYLFWGNHKYQDKDVYLQAYIMIPIIEGYLKEVKKTQSHMDMWINYLSVRNTFFGNETPLVVKMYKEESALLDIEAEKLKKELKIYKKREAWDALKYDFKRNQKENIEFAVVDYLHRHGYVRDGTYIGRMGRRMELQGNNHGPIMYENHYDVPVTYDEPKIECGTVPYQEPVQTNFQKSGVPLEPIGEASSEVMKDSAKTIPDVVKEINPDVVTTSINVAEGSTGFLSAIIDGISGLFSW